jgi:hypothetical protein
MTTQKLNSVDVKNACNFQCQCLCHKEEIKKNESTGVFKNIYNDFTAPVSFSRSFLYGCGTVFAVGVFREIHTWAPEVILERSKTTLMAAQIVFGLLFGYNFSKHITKKGGE